MSSLSALFTDTERKPKLEQRLATAETLGELKSILEEELRSYQNLEGPYKQSLSQPQAIKAGKMLDDMMASLSYLDAVSFKAVEVQLSTSPRITGRNLASGAIGGSVASLVASGNILIVPVGFGIGLLASCLVSLAQPENSDNKLTPIKLEMVVDSIYLFAHIEKCFATIDEAVEAVHPRQSQPTHTQDYMPLMKVLQQLLGAARNEKHQLPDLTRDLMKSLESILGTAQIEARFYQDGISDVESLFDIEIVEELTEPITIEPAFVKIRTDGEVLLRGRVQLPPSR